MKLFGNIQLVGCLLGLINGVGTNFGFWIGGRRGEARRESVSSLSGVLGGAPAVEGYYEPPDCLSQHLSTCCIQFVCMILNLRLHTKFRHIRTIRG